MNESVRTSSLKYIDIGNLTDYREKKIVSKRVAAIIIPYIITPPSIKKICIIFACVLIFV